MIIVGLTGSIGTGKSTVTKQFACLGAATLDSDLVVHRLLAAGGAAVEKTAKQFPQTLEGDHINRRLLGAEVFGNTGKRKMLEAIIHPMVREAQQAFMRTARREGKNIAVLDIPLLFETGAEKRCDVIVVTTAAPLLQRQRVLKRPNMTEEKFLRILKAQMPDAEKRKRADYIVNTGAGKYNSLSQVRRIIRALMKQDKQHA